MKISVIITSYKYGKYLKAAIESALKQSFDAAQFEIIVVYRESGDETVAILEEYKQTPNFRVIKQAGKGLANASNLGIKNSSGEYVIRLDADDIFYENILAEEAKVLDANPEVDFVYPDYVYYIEKENKRIRKYLPDFDKQELIGRGDFLSGGTMYRRVLFDKVGYFDESLQTLESYEYILRLIHHNIRGYHLALPLFEYRLHVNSMSQNVELGEKTGKMIANKFGVNYTIGEHHPRRIEI